MIEDQDTDRRTPLSLIADAWPEGVPALEKAYWAVLDEALRRRAARRIRAFERFEIAGSWSERAEEAGLTQPTFFALLRRWRDRKSLSAVVPGLAPRRGRRVGERFPTGVREAIARLTRLNPDMPSSRLAEMVRLAVPNAPAQSAMKPVIDDERAIFEAERLGGRAGLGRRLLIDTCPMSYRSAKTTEWEPEAWCGFVVDIATRTVVGWSTSDRKDVAYAGAALRAAEAVRRWHAPNDLAGSPEPEFEIGAPDNLLAHLLCMVELMRDGFKVGSPMDEQSSDARGRAVGSRLVQVLGPRLGPLELHPRSEMRKVVSAGSPEPDERTAIREAEVVGTFLDHEIELRGETGVGSNRSAVDPSRVEEALRRLGGSKRP